MFNLHKTTKARRISIYFVRKVNYERERFLEKIREVVEVIPLEGAVRLVIWGNDVDLGRK